MSNQNEKYQIQEFVVIQNGACIPMVLYDTVKLQIETRLVELIPDVIYTSKTLCGKEFWSRLTPRNKNLAGMCVKHLVEKGYLELVAVKWDHEYPKKYKLK